MDEYVAGEGQAEETDLLDLNEVMQAFGVKEWRNLGLVEETPADNVSLRVEIEGQAYILSERSEGLIEEDGRHRYAFLHFLQQTGIPIPSLWLTPEGEPQ